MEYNRCAIPRLTAKLGRSEADKQEKEEEEQERELENKVQEEIRRRRKERCKDRREEVVEEKQGPVKRRRLEESGNYKRVLSLKEKRGEEKRKEREQPPNTNTTTPYTTCSKKQKIVEERDEVPGRMLGEEIKGMEIWDIDWEKRRRERQKEIDQEEKARERRLTKSRRLEESWGMAKECRRILIENNQRWMTLKEREEKMRKEHERTERLAIAGEKKRNLLKRTEQRKAQLKITDLLQKIPGVERDKLEKETEEEEKAQLREIQENLWKNWRGRKREGKVKIPTDDEKIGAKLAHIKKRVREYVEEKKRRMEKIATKRKDDEEKRARKLEEKRMEDHWAMLNWLNMFIEKNKYLWEKRRMPEQKEMTRTRWLEKTHEEQIEDLKEEENEKEKKKNKAKVRNDCWKQHRKPVEETECDDDDENHLMKKTPMKRNRGEEITQMRKKDKEKIRKCKEEKTKILGVVPGHVLLQGVDMGRDPATGGEEMVERRKRKDKRMRRKEKRNPTRKKMKVMSRRIPQEMAKYMMTKNKQEEEIEKLMTNTMNNVMTKE